uniref:Uncharacterized protein n=1 Tax=Tanacetum cinerariifolium TaxID=118510 RepID=A0A6L2J977_TANCI|nr:hypothetical protein [Tanacetum cinerariifolium]
MIDCLFIVFGDRRWMYNTNTNGVHTCGSRSFTTTRKVVSGVSANVGGSGGVDGSVGEGELDGVVGSDGVCGSNEEGNLNRDVLKISVLTPDGVLTLERRNFTPSTATSYPPNAVEVLQKSFEELKEARTRYKKLFEEAKEENRKQYEKKLVSHALTMKEEMAKEANAKIDKMFAQYTQQPLIRSP